MSLKYKPEEAIAHLKAADPAMSDLIDRVGDFSIETEFGVSPFQVLLRGIVFQQLSGTAASAIYERFLELFDDPENVTPEEIAKFRPEQLKEVGLSKAKILAVKDLAEKRLEGVIPDLAELEAMDDAEIIERLTSVRGVGEWTVQIMLIFRLGRPDVFPATDLGIRKGYQKVFESDELPNFGELETFGERWMPYRSVASWYLWRATDPVDSD